MPRPIKIKIDVTKISKEDMFKGKKGTYLDIACWPNKDGLDQYGNTHYLVQEISKEKRDAGQRAPIIGNAVIETQSQQADLPGTRVNTPKAAAKDPAVQQDADDDVPF